VPVVKHGESQSAAADSGARAERFAAIKNEYDAVMNAYYDLWRNAKTDEDREKLAKTAKPPDVGEFTARARALIDEDPADETAFGALKWMLQAMRGESTATMAVPLLAKHHFEREEMGDLVRFLDSAGPEGVALVERLSEKSPHASVRGKALYARGEHVLEDKQLADEIKGTPEGKDKDELKTYVGEERFRKLSTADSKSFDEPALVLFKRVQTDYGAVKLNPGTEWESTLGERATASIFEIENLAVGKLVPDISAEDVDGVAFRLSDYRGKVVMLDFWGFW
jgi:hypothetical protein